MNKLKFKILKDEGFPNYAICNKKYVINLNTNKILTPTNNTVSMYKNGICKGFGLDKLYRKYFKNYIDNVPDTDKINLSIVGASNYIITKNGKIWSLRNYKWLKFQIHKNYNKNRYSICLYLDNGNTLFTALARLLAKAFIKRPNHLKNIPFKKLQVNHIDGDPSNNKLSNLEWCTQLENNRHAFDIGIWNRTITRKEAIQTCKLLESGLHPKTISKKINIPLHCIYDIKYGRTYNDIVKQFNLPTIKKNPRVSDKIKHKVCKMLEKGYSSKDIQEKCKVNKTFVWDIFHKKRNVDISKQYNF